MKLSITDLYFLLSWFLKVALQLCHRDPQILGELRLDPVRQIVCGKEKTQHISVSWVSSDHYWRYKMVFAQNNRLHHTQQHALSRRREIMKRA